MRTINAEDISGGHVMPVDQGQIVERIWYAHEDGPILVVVDASENHAQRIQSASDGIQYRWPARDPDPYQPWNGHVGRVGRGVRVRIVGRHED